MYRRDQGIAVTTFSLLARGWRSGSKKVRSQTDASFITFHGDALDLEIISKVEATAEEHGTTMAEVALAWVYSKEAICCPIIGVSSVKQLANNVRALEAHLSPDEIGSLDDLYRPRDVINDYAPIPMPRYLERKRTRTTLTNRPWNCSGQCGQSSKPKPSGTLLLPRNWNACSPNCRSSGWIQIDPERSNYPYAATFPVLSILEMPGRRRQWRQSSETSSQLSTGNITRAAQ